MKVYVVIQNFVSHDMFVSDSAKIGDPKIVGVFTTRAKARKLVRPHADDYIETFTLDSDLKAGNTK